MQLVHVGGSMQDEEAIYFIMEYVAGGELFAHLRAAEGHRLTETRARFYVSEIILALQYMHEEVMYRLSLLRARMSCCQLCNGTILYYSFLLSLNGFKPARPLFLPGKHRVQRP